MHRLFAALSVVLVAACAPPSDDGMSASSQALGFKGGDRYVVVFRAGKLPAEAAAHVQKAGGTVSATMPEVGVLTASGDAAFAASLKKNPAVLAVGYEQSFALPKLTQGATIEESAVAAVGPSATDSLYYIYQWDMRRVGAPAVWSRLPLATGGRKAQVAVLDVGVADNHPDLVGQVCGSKATGYCSTSGGPSNTPGYPKYASVIDFDANPSWSPADGCTPINPVYEAHGTHVAGTIAAKFGGGRVVGVDPDACVAAYKVFDRYRYTDPVEGLIEDVGAFDGPLFMAIIDAVNNRIPVISMSLGGTTRHQGRDGAASWQAWNRVIDYANRAGTVVVAAAGNSGLDLNGTTANLPGDLPAVLNVSATGWSQLSYEGGIFQFAPGSHDVLAFYSNVGASVNIAGPGGDCGPGFPYRCEAQYLILSDYIFPDGRMGYAFFAGTSMATPHVSAVAAMVRALHPDWTPGAVRAFLTSTAQPLGDRQLFGAGMVDADAATR